MNKNLLYLLFSFTILLSSCSKSWMEDRLEGTWRLKTAERTRLLNRNTINTGYEDGRFIFQENGNAFYTDSQLAMNGDWVIRKVRDMYNNDGDQNQNIRMALSINLVDFTSRTVLNLQFDKMKYRSRNSFFAVYETSGYRYRYEFVRD